MEPALRRRGNDSRHQHTTAVAHWPFAQLRPRPSLDASAAHGFRTLAVHIPNLGARAIQRATKML